MHYFDFFFGGGGVLLFLFDLLLSGLHKLGVEVPQHGRGRSALALTVNGDVLTKVSHILGLDLSYDHRTL